MNTSAIAGYCEAFIAVTPSRWPVRKLLNQFDRYYAAYLLIHNFYGWRAGDPALPTLARLKSVASLSPRHTTHFVGVLKTAGFVQADAVEGDRRQTVLRPEPLLVQEIGRSILAFLAAQDRIAGTGRAEVLARDTDRLGLLIHLSARKVLEGGAVIVPFPTIASLSRFDSGYPVLTALMASHYALAEGRVAESLTLETLAERFQVSRSHVSNVLAYLSASGKLDANRRPRACLVDEFERWCREETAHYAGLADDPRVAGPRHGAPQITLPASPSGA